MAEIKKNDSLSEEGRTDKEITSAARKKTKLSKLKARFSITKPGATPINWKVIVLTVVALFGSCYSITFLFPFVPDMILHFGYKEEEKGYYAGLIAASMFAGRIFGSYFWGWLSDVKGRRPVIIICLVVIAITNLVFGFSVNVAMAIVCRFLCGLFNGIVGASKTVLYEVSDNTNQAAGMSAIAMAWGSGIIMGPLFSGYLSEPALRYPALFSLTGLFGKFPYLLASILATLLPLIAAILVYFFLPETLNKNRKSDNELEIDVNNENKNTKEEEKLLNKNLSQIEESSMAGKAIINRQLSRVRGANVQCKSSEELGPTASLSHPNIHLLKNEDTTLAKGYSPSIASLEYMDASRSNVNTTQKDDPASHLYGYGCIVTSQGDLLLPDYYRGSSYSNLFKRQRSALSESSDNSVKNQRKKPPKLTSSLSVPYDKQHSVSSDGGGGGGGGGSLPNIANDGSDIIEAGNTDDYDKCHIEIINGNDENTDSNNSQNRCQACWKSFKEFNFVALMSQKDVAMPVWIYTIMSFGTIGFDDVFTIWASTDVKYSGLGFTPLKIGNALGLSSVPLVVIQVFLFPYMEARMGAKKLFGYMCLVLIANCLLIPSLRIFQGNTYVFWTLLLLLMGLNKVAQTSCFSANGLHINNSVPPQYAGSVNGIAMTFTAIGRTIAPIAGGSIFAWSIVHGVKIGFPFDVNLVFIIFSFSYLITNILCAMLPPGLDKQKKKQV